MAAKPSTMYSTNPKMDRSGITAKQPRSEMVPTKNGFKVEARDNYDTCSYWDK